MRENTTRMAWPDDRAGLCFVAKEHQGEKSLRWWDDCTTCTPASCPCPALSLRCASTSLGGGHLPGSGDPILRPKTCSPDRDSLFRRCYSPVPAPVLWAKLLIALDFYKSLHLAPPPLQGFTDTAGVHCTLGLHSLSETRKLGTCCVCCC